MAAASAAASASSTNCPRLSPFRLPVWPKLVYLGHIRPELNRISAPSGPISAAFGPSSIESWRFPGQFRPQSARALLTFGAVRAKFGRSRPQDPTNSTQIWSMPVPEVARMSSQHRPTSANSTQMFSMPVPEGFRALWALLLYSTADGAHPALALEVPAAACLLVAAFLSCLRSSSGGLPSGTASGSPMFLKPGRWDSSKKSALACPKCRNPSVTRLAVASGRRL